ncbi:hypothetical protein Mal52_16740 [Symmachiella dynata]|uniref:Uncharacterized protein n=1 Tax=Symmachiella dynata TaxID=2527995 RepID=A0A517ZL32_9PLAN|nr:hypothetical protein Mal52_16740 [Symmachiella dynata]
MCAFSDRANLLVGMRTWQKRRKAALSEWGFRNNLQLPTGKITPLPDPYVLEPVSKPSDQSQWDGAEGFETICSEKSSRDALLIGFHGKSVEEANGSR